MTRDTQFCYRKLRMQGDPSLPLLRYANLPPRRSQSATMENRFYRFYNESRMWQSLISMVANCDLTSGKLEFLSSGILGSPCILVTLSLSKFQSFTNVMLSFRFSKKVHGRIFLFEKSTVYIVSYYLIRLFNP